MIHIVWVTWLEDDEDTCSKRKQIEEAIDYRGPWYSAKMIEKTRSKVMLKTKYTRKMHVPIETAKIDLWEN